MATNPKDKQRQYDAARKARQGKRARGWAAVSYDDSAAPDAIDQLKDLHIEVLISPVHDQDVDGTGNQKKPHQHILLMFPSPVPAATAKQVWDGINAVPEQDKHGNMRSVQNIQGYARYLVHMDDHDKHRYNEEDVTELGGASWKKTALSEADVKRGILSEIEEFIDAHEVTSYVRLCRYARNRRTEWLDTIRSNSYHLKAILQSMQWEIREETFCDSDDWELPAEEEQDDSDEAVI